MVDVFDVQFRFLVVFPLVEGLLPEVIDLSYETNKLHVFLSMIF